MRITHVASDSPAEALGLIEGDKILAINGERFRDELDFHFHMADDAVVFDVEREGRGAFSVTYERGFLDTEFGADFEDPKVRLCGNDCVFCFVDQSPAGMRKSVYVRDEDYRLSFLYGNFITLTNLKEWEVRRILTQRLTPLYISVHSLDPDIRERLFATPRARDILPRLDRLLEGGIALHTQIVLCPGFNDGEDLDRTVRGLAGRREAGIESLAVVPVGLTSHRGHLPKVRSVTREDAEDVMGRVEAWQVRFRAETGRAFVYLADEWYAMVGRETPPAEHYDGFPQLEDGIGLTRHFLEQLDIDGTRMLRTLADEGLTHVTVVTGELFHPTMAREMARHGAEVASLRVDVRAVRNDFFGGGVNVAGLLTGRDILAQLSGDALGERVCLPPVAVNEEGRLMDDATLPELSRALGVPVTAGFGLGGIQ